MTRRRTPANHLALLVMLAALAGGLASCAAPREDLGTVNGSCYLDLPAAVAAVHHQGRLDGVRLVSPASLRAGEPRLFAAAEVGGERTGDVCLVAFSGAFAAASVQKPFGAASGRIAIVELGFPTEHLFATVVLPRAPFDFAHGRV